MPDKQLVDLREKWIKEAGKKIPATKMPTVIQLLNMMVNGDISSPYATKAAPKKKATTKKKTASKKK